MYKIEMKFNEVILCAYFVVGKSYTFLKSDERQINDNFNFYNWRNRNRLPPMHYFDATGSIICSVLCCRFVETII